MSWQAGSGLGLDASVGYSRVAGGSGTGDRDDSVHGGVTLRYRF